MAIRMALQIPNFTYPDTPPSALFERVAATAREAEAAGFDAVLVMDHFYQLPMLGPTHHEMLEAYPLLGAIARVPERHVVLRPVLELLAGGGCHRSFLRNPARGRPS